MISARRWLGLGASAVVLLAVLYLLSGPTEWRSLSWQQLWSFLAKAHTGWLFAAVLTSYGTYLVRAYRWRFFLDPVKKASVWGLFVGQVIGFSSIYLLGRPGEIVRPAYIAKREGVPFASQVAVWLLERVYDSVFLVLLFALAFHFEPIEPTTPRGVRVLHRMHEGVTGILFLTGVLLIALALFRLSSDTLTERLTHASRFFPEKFRAALARVLRSFAEGLEVIRNWKDFLAGAACTVVLWAMNTTIFWLAFRSLGGSIGELSWWAAALVLFFAALGLLFQLPGVGGGYQVGIILTLRHFFHLPPAEVTSAGILVWVVVMAPCIALGALLLIYEGLSFRKLHTLAAEGRAATAEKPEPAHDSR